MSNQITPVANTPAPSYTPEQIKLIKNTVAKGATDDEFKLFMYRAWHMGFDPLKPGQIYFIKYGNSPGTIVVGIDGFRCKAARTGKHSGTNRGIIRDEKGKCIGAFAEVYRSDWQKPAREEIALSEYNTGKGNWAKMPETMIKKVAEAAALRIAFPEDLGGIYTREEMEQAEPEPVKTKSELTPLQRKFWDAVKKSGAWDKVQVRQYLASRYKKTNTAELTESEVAESCVYFAQNQPAALLVPTPRPVEKNSTESKGSVSSGGIQPAVGETDFAEVEKFPFEQTEQTIASNPSSETKTRPSQADYPAINPGWEKELATEKQIARLYAIGKENGYDNAQLKELAWDLFEKEHLEELTKSEIQVIFKEFEGEK